MKARGTAYGVWWGDKRERGRLEDLGVDGKIILKWIFKEEEEEGVDRIDLS
jgi:hypothetical protein